MGPASRDAARFEIGNGDAWVRATARGARLLSVRLRGFALEVGASAADKIDPNKALELVYHSKAPVSAFSIFLPAGPYSDPTHPLRPIVGMLETADWEMERVAPEGDFGEGVRWRLAAGPLLFTKTFRLASRGYKGSFSLEVAVADPSLEASRDASSTLQILVLPGGWLFSDHDQFFPSPYVAAAHGKGSEPGSVTTKLATSLTLGPDPAVPAFGDVLQRPEGERFRFVADANKYFVAALLPRDPLTTDALVSVKMLGIRARDLRDKPEDRAASVALLQTRLPKTGAPVRFEFDAFLGPKSPEALASAPDLESIPRADRQSFLSFGWLSAAFTAGLKFFAGITHNWGVAIILLTICLRALLFPITRKSQGAMADLAAKQAAIKPLLDELQKKHKDNPKKLNEERFRIFREHKVPITPPVVGCLPIFLNIPIFVGFFSAIRTLYELRHEPFFLWVTDLSKPDELFTFASSFHLPLVGEVRGLNVLPLIMMAMWVVTQIVMQKNMPRPSDPQQAQVQKFAMVLSTVIGLTLYNYASGLSLYAITSSTITVLEQTLIRKFFPPPGVRAAAAAAAAQR